MDLCFDLKDLYHEKTQYGDYVAFNGSENFKDIIIKILDNPKSYDLLEINEIRLDFDNDVEEEFEYIKVEKSWRQAKNNIQYEWFIRYNHFINVKEALNFNNWLFASATLIEKLLNEGHIKTDSIISDLPQIKDKNNYAWENSGGKLLISKEENKAESLQQKIYDFVQDVIKDREDARTDIDISDYQEKEELLQKLKQENDNLRSNIDNLLAIIEKQEDQASQFENEINLLKAKIAKQRQDKEEQKNDLKLFFKALFPKFKLLRPKQFFQQLSFDKHSEEHVKKLSAIYEEVISKKISIEKIDGSKKVEDLNHWYQFFVEITKTDVHYPQGGVYDHQWSGGVNAKRVQKRFASFYICEVTEHGNVYYYLHFGENSSSLLENYDPPRFDPQKLT
tara:strand:- start:127 stop:1305 length:1179 start_codon:yes stop_codon:yes gene_type:complete